MALTEINLEGLTPRTTATRTNLALLRNEISSLDNSMEFGDWIKQVFALMQQADITGSVGYGLLETDISENVRTAVNVLNSVTAEQLSSDTYHVEEDLGLISVSPLTASFTLLDGTDPADPSRSAVANWCHPSIACGESGAITLAGGSNVSFYFIISSIDSSMWKRVAQTNITNNTWRVFHYQKAIDLYWAGGYAVLYQSSDNHLTWSDQRTHGSDHFTDIASNRKVLAYNATTPNDSSIALFISELQNGSSQAHIGLAVGLTPNTPGTGDLTYITGGSTSVQNSIAYSPTLDIFVTASDVGSGNILSIVAGTYPNIVTAVSESNLQGTSVTWANDAFFVCNGTTTIKSSSDLSTWSTYTLPTGAEANRVKQWKCRDGEDSTNPWWIILCNNSEVYFTKDWTTYYNRKVGATVQSVDWWDMSMINDHMAVLVGGDSELAMLIG